MWFFLYFFNFTEGSLSKDKTGIPQYSIESLSLIYARSSPAQYNIFNWLSEPSQVLHGRSRISQTPLLNHRSWFSPVSIRQTILDITAYIRYCLQKTGRNELKNDWFVADKETPLCGQSTPKCLFLNWSLVSVSSYRTRSSAKGRVQNALINDWFATAR